MLKQKEQRWCFNFETETKIDFELFARDVDILADQSKHRSEHLNSREHRKTEPIPKTLDPVVSSPLHPERTQTQIAKPIPGLFDPPPVNFHRMYSPLLDQKSTLDAAYEMCGA